LRRLWSKKIWKKRFGSWPKTASSGEGRGYLDLRAFQGGAQAPKHITINALHRRPIVTLELPQAEMVALVRFWTVDDHDQCDPPS
jgi:hypothetical protein